jgi:hypothetical protein
VEIHNEIWHFWTKVPRCFRKSKKKIKKRGVKIGPKSLKKFTKKKNQMKIVMRFGTFGNYFWTRVPRRCQNSKKMDKRGAKVGPRVYKMLQKEKRKANNNEI